jgi:diacylglycerol kinase family enzyme
MTDRLKTRYAIITNPVSGLMSADQKRTILASAAEILDAEIYGLDTLSAKGFVQCAQELADHCDVLVTAGGDGTLSDVINAVDTTRTPIAYLPLGSGNAMRYALKYKGNLADIAVRIKNGTVHDCDLINCEDKAKAFTVSLGIEGSVIQLRDRYVAQGAAGFKPYVRALLNSYFKIYKPADADINIDGRLFREKNLLSLMIVKHPYYGYGMNVVPKARFNDRKMHICCIDARLFTLPIGVVTAFTVNNRIGRYHTGRKMTVTLARPLLLQFNGNTGWESSVFSFKVLPKALKIKY